MIQDPFSEEYFWFDESEWNSEPLDTWDTHALDSARENWGWDEWGDLCVFRPLGYEPAYRYPLLVWLTLDESPDQLLRDWFPDLSDRNFVGVGVRIQKAESLARNAELVASSIREVAALYGIHHSRIWLAGLESGANWAMKLFSSLSKLTRGVIAIAPGQTECAEVPVPSSLKEKSLFLACEDGLEWNWAEPLIEQWEAAQGQADCLTIETWGSSRLAICKELNIWLMEQVCAPSTS